MGRSYQKNAQCSRDSGRYIAFPVNILDSTTYQLLSFSAKSLLVDIASQFKGENNGRLVACEKFLKPRGWKSKATISKALKELCESGLLIMTRRGARPNKASYFGLAWYSLGCRVIESQLDFDGRIFERERHQWKAKERELKVAFKPPLNGLEIVQIVPKSELRDPSTSPINEPILLKSNLALPQNMGTF